MQHLDQVDGTERKHSEDDDERKRQLIQGEAQRCVRPEDGETFAQLTEHARSLRGAVP